MYASLPVLDIFLIIKYHLRIFLALTSSGTTMEKLLSHCKDPAQSIDGTLKWGSIARRSGLTALLSRPWHQLHVLLPDTTNSALVFAQGVLSSLHLPDITNIYYALQN